MISHPGRWLSLCSSAAIVVALWIPPAFAGGGGGKSGGALSNTTRSVRNATSAPSRPASTSSGSSSSSGYSDDGLYHDNYRRPYCMTCTYVSPGRPPSRGAPGQRSATPTRLALDMGLQSVENSDGAFMGSLRMTKGNLGIGVSGTRYFERTPALDGSDIIHMDVWSLTFAGRGYATDATELWFDGGIGGSKSNEFQGLMGATVGARLEHVLSSSLSLRGAVRYFVLEQGIRAHELYAAISASYVSVGYRLFSFNVGEDLHGPEFGVSLRF